MKYSPEKKIGRPHLLEGGQDIEIGQPVIEESQKEVDLDFKGYGLMLEDALHEFAANLSTDISEKHDPENKRFVDGALRTLQEDIRKKDVVIPLGLIEAILVSFEKIENRAHEFRESGDIPREKNIDDAERAHELAIQYSEAEDFFYSHSELFDAMPERADFVEWLKNEIHEINEGIREDAEYANEDFRKHCESRLKSEVPGMVRFVRGEEVPEDYNTILSIIGDKIFYAREQIKNLLQIYFLGTAPDEHKEEIEGQLRFIFILRSFAAILEGERNERAVLKK